MQYCRVLFFLNDLFIWPCMAWVLQMYLKQKCICSFSQGTEVPELAVDAIKNVSSKASKRSVYHSLFKTAEFKEHCHYFANCILLSLFLGKKDKKKNKVPEKKESHHSVKSQSPEVSLKPTPAPSKDDPPVKKSDTPPPIQEEDKQKQPPSPPPPISSSPNSDPPLLPSPEDPRPPFIPSSAYKKDRKLSSPLSRSPHTTASSQPPEPSQEIMQPQTQTPAKKEGPTKSPSNEPKKKPQQHTQPSSVASYGRNC